MRLAQLGLMACLYLLTQACSNTPTNSNSLVSQACIESAMNDCMSSTGQNSNFCNNLINSTCASPTLGLYTSTYGEAFRFCILQNESNFSINISTNTINACP